MKKTYMHETKIICTKSGIYARNEDICMKSGRYARIPEYMHESQNISRTQPSAQSIYHSCINQIQEDFPKALSILPSGDPFRIEAFPFHDGSQVSVRDR